MNCMLCLGYLIRIVGYIDRDLRLLVRDRHRDVFRCRRCLDRLLLVLVVLLVVVLLLLIVQGRDIDVIRYQERCRLLKRIMLCQSM